MERAPRALTVDIVKVSTSLFPRGAVLTGLTAMSKRTSLAHMTYKRELLTVEDGSNLVRALEIFCPSNRDYLICTSP